MAKNMPNILICAGHRNEIRAYHNGNVSDLAHQTLVLNEANHDWYWHLADCYL